ncbi:MAG: phosphopantothenoylcysteine decarboxylase [Endomicrobium sp.]|jgi:phosphopantothenoylcysteine synthetase/decarboxylase|nr:phosphopantothenoylcysteine decarboxylase [Endomicrobium sp.]
MIPRQASPAAPFAKRGINGDDKMLIQRQTAKERLRLFMKRLTFLITSGPTREYLDPVRYISNESSGKMGAALCEAALKIGHKVIFVSGKAAYYPKGKAEIINVVSADDMFKAVKKNFKRANIIIGAAAVSDFKPANFSKSKIKKENILTLKLKQNPDILAYCGKNKKNQAVAGFALETDDLIKNAAKKLKDKNLDLIIANGGESLGSDKTSVFFISKNRVLCKNTADGGRHCPPLDESKTASLKPSSAFVVVAFKETGKKIVAGKIINETISIFANIKAGKNFA